MSIEYDRQIGRIRLVVNDNGATDHNYGYGCLLQIREGWNDGCAMISNNMSVEELHDLRHLIDRALRQTAP